MRLPSTGHEARAGAGLRAGLLVLLAFAALGFAPGCTGEERTTLTVLASEPLTAAFEAMAVAFEDANPGVDVEFVFASADELTSRLRDGYLADLVATTGAGAMAALAESGLTEAGDEFTTDGMIVALREGFTLTSVEQLADEGVRIVVASADDPAGQYARDVIDRAAEEYGEDWKAQVLANIEEEAANAAEVLERIKDGKGDAGFVYKSGLTDVAVEAGLSALPLPARLAIAIVYPAALTAQPVEIILAREFIEFLLSDQGQAILGSFGFGEGL